jgi:nucleotide-binding universal stress UspA family protein
MSSVVRSVRRRKKSRVLGPVRGVGREEYEGLDVGTKVELIRAVVPLGLRHVQQLLYKRRRDKRVKFTKLSYRTLGRAPGNRVTTPLRSLYTADLAVLSRPKPKGAGTAREFLLATLFNSARPVLILPQRRIGRLGTRVLIAWNQRPEAALAVTASLPLLQKAEQVTIVTCGPEDRPGPKATHLRDYLAHWGIRTEHLRTRGRDVDDEIGRSYRDMGADLLVMGAYSRHRMRERIFGGVTETMLFRSNLPVLMYHP